MICDLLDACTVIRIIVGKTVAVSAVFALTVGLTACGGGGGGGGSSSGGGGSDSSSGVRVLHAAIDGLPVDVVSSARGGAVTSKIFFADKKGYRGLSSGAQSLSLVSSLNAGDVVASFDVTSSGDDAYSILLYGSLGGSGLRVKLIEDAAPEDFSGALVRFVHGVAGASSVIVNAVGGEGPQQVSLGSVSDYIAVAPGSVRLTASRGADSQRLMSITEDLEEGGAYTVLVAGEAGYYTKGVLFRDR
jgi:hypothetical protein